MFTYTLYPQSSSAYSDDDHTNPDEGVTHFMLTLHKGEILFRQGETGSLFQLHKGLVKVVRIQADGTLFLFNLLIPGELFPHHSLVSPKVYHGTAIAVTDCELTAVPADAWYAKLAADPLRYRDIAISLQQKLRIMQQRIDQLASITAKERLEAFLTWFRNQFPTVNPLEVLTQEEISQFIGIRRETVNRLLNARQNAVSQGQSST